MADETDLRAYLLAVLRKEVPPPEGYEVTTTTFRASDLPPGPNLFTAPPTRSAGRDNAFRRMRGEATPRRPEPPAPAPGEGAPWTST